MKKRSRYRGGSRAQRGFSRENSSLRSLKKRRKHTKGKGSKGN
jgi:hypothetical protein